MTQGESPNTNGKPRIAKIPTVSLPVRRVLQTDEGYVVAELKSPEHDFWLFVSKYYPHSTSAFAALGRLTQKDVMATVPKEWLKYGKTPHPTDKPKYSGKHKIND